MFRRLACVVVIAIVLALVLLHSPIHAQSDNSVARVQVVAPGVEIQRVGTSRWVPIKAESLVGVGDAIRTVEQGQATLSFAEGVLTLALDEQSEAAIDVLTGDAITFAVQVDFRAGFGRFATLRSLEADGQFVIVMPGFKVTVAEGQGDLRIESTGRSAVLTSASGQLTAQAGAASVPVPARHGVRAEAGGVLSDVVAAPTFPRLDAALDGCPSTLNLEGDVRLNVRLGPSREFRVVGGLANDTPLQAMGVTASGGWYRVQFKGGFGWIEVRRLPLTAACAGLRIFPDAHGPENATLFSDLTETYDISAAATPTR
jgi:Bacterial SH3 domain